MKQTENIPVDTNKPGVQPNMPPVNEQEKQQHRHDEKQGQTPPQKPLSPDTFSK
ncbi:MAG: hypothetical protein ITG01_13070 [Comamonas sp.]|nr:hypothetical protein [Comamonas sp.]